MDEALAILHKQLGLIGSTGRSLFSADEVEDILLDIQQALTREAVEEEPVLETV